MYIDLTLHNHSLLNISHQKFNCSKVFIIVYNYKIIVRYKKIGYNIDVLRQTACLVVNPIKVNSFAYLFNCTTVGRASD